MDATQRVRAMLSFVQAADRGSFAAAARTLGISAAAVGKNVAGLEGALGVRLMNRSTRSLQLTTEGQGFLQGARDAIAALDAAIDTVSAQRAQPEGRVRIACSSAFGHTYLMPLLPALCAKYPALVPDVALDDRRVDIVGDGFDMALRGGLLEDSSLVSRHICDLRTVLVASPTYLAAHGVPKRVEDLTKHRLVAVRFLQGNMAMWTFNGNDGSILERAPGSHAVLVSDPQASVLAAVLGLGIAQVAVHHAWPYLQTGALQVVLGKHHASGHRTMALQYPHRALVAPRVRATVDYLLEGFANNPALHVGLEQLRPYWAVE